MGEFCRREIPPFFNTKMAEGFAFMNLNIILKTLIPDFANLNLNCPGWVS